MFGLWFSLKVHGLQIGKSEINTRYVAYYVKHEKNLLIFDDFGNRCVYMYNTHVWAAHQTVLYVARNSDYERLAALQTVRALVPDSNPLGFFCCFFNLAYSPWTSSLPSCLWSQRIFPSLPGSRLTIFYRDASSALLQLVNQWLNFTYSRSHAFRYERKNTNPTLVRIELMTSALAGVQVTY